MFSICIPVYRYDVRPLVAELLRQAGELDGGFEILVYDDASGDEGDWGREELRQTAGIRYVELTNNLGRAAIRNKMAREASSDYLLMLDADGWPHADFLNDYFLALQELWRGTEQLAVGGREYATEPPEKPYRLHWHYGHERETPTAEERIRESYLGFQSNNFLVARSVLLAHPFPVDAVGYGHEDTLWGQELARQNIGLLHIHNPVTHLGLEPAAIFLRKQRQAIRNLALLKQQAPHLRTRLIDLVERYPRLSALATYLPEDWLVNYLTNRSRPNLLALDLLKLQWWYAR